nr:PREDICTED: zinc finger CCCH domain-containing protein 7B [Lepisosteus oculatus]
MQVQIPGEAQLLHFGGTSMDGERQKRKEEIQKALGFIQSSLPYPEPEGYEAFLTQLVCNLLDEGNAVYREGDLRQAVVHYTEGLGVADYARAENLSIAAELLGSLYVNRAAALYNTGGVTEGGGARPSRQWARADVPSAQCIPAPLAMPVPVSDDPAVTSDDLDGTPEDPGQGPQPGVPYSVPESVDEVIGEELDSLLECMPKGAELSMAPVQGAIPTNLPNTVAHLLPSYAGGAAPSSLPPAMPPPTPQLPPAFFGSAVSQLNALDSFPGLGSGEGSGTPSLDALDSFPLAAVATTGGGRVAMGGSGLDSLSEFTLPGGRAARTLIPGLRASGSGHTNGPAGPGAGSALAVLSRNPLAASHEFRQACHACYSRIGPKVMDYKYQPEAAHRCKRDVLLCRLKGSDDPAWKRIRPRPARNNFLGAFVLCKEVQERQECKYGENCTFAYCQEEIDVWTQERKGALSRELLFDPLGSSERRALSVTRLLQLHMGMFMFLCEECYDSKPRIISKRCKENLSVCSNLTARHPFDGNKCLVHVVRSANVRYSKIRPLHPLCQFDVCRHEVRYGCQREDSCSFAHSVIELKCWVLQQDTGITHEEIVQESKRHWHRLEQNMQKQKMCVHVVKQKKCHYIGNCSFAHSPEERDVWTYMKNNSLRDMQQMYDMWLSLTNQNRRPDGTLITPPPEEKQITMPTDYAEPMNGFHCRLCGKHSNSERQWQQHISSEKHKDRVFSCEGEEEGLDWTYRFPGCCFSLCSRMEGGSCPEGASCDSAHSAEELAEWEERRDFLRRKLAKARDDMLIAPSDCDFGKYNFLLQD